MKKQHLTLLLGKQTIEFDASRDGDGIEIKQAERTIGGTVEVIASNELRVSTGQGVVRAHVARDGDVLWVRVGGRTHRLVRRNAAPKRRGAGSDDGADEIQSPMTGKVAKVQAAVGDDISPGQVLVVVEAMKMEYQLKSSIAARVVSVDCKAGEQVEMGRVLVRLEKKPAP